MFKHPASTNNNTTVNPIDETMVQPNTIDLRLQYVYEITGSEFHIDEQGKKHRKVVKLEPNAEGNYVLESGHCYEFVATQMVHVGENEMAVVLGRSTFNRNGVLIISSVYDSGFKDYVGATVYNIAGSTTVKPDTRFAHLILADAEMINSYQGSYGIQ